MHRSTIEWIYDVGRRARDKHREDPDLTVEYRETRDGFELEFKDQGQTLIAEEQDDGETINYKVISGRGTVKTEDTITMPEDQGVLEEFALSTVRYGFS